METPECQLHSLPRIQEPVRRLDRILQFLFYRLRRFTKRRINYAKNKLTLFIYPNKKFDNQTIPKPIAKTESLKPGDMVRIRSKEEIRAILDPWNRLKGCGFLEEMWPYCSTTQRVYKRVERFLDERDFVVKKCRNLVILEGVFCHGTADFGKCDRTCFFFWREEWLEKLD